MDTKQYKGLIAVLLLIATVAFYWYELRPANIRKECKKHVTEIGISISSQKEREELGWNMNKINQLEQEKSDFWYKDCLNERGIER